jgi:hypothetical protein
MLHILEPIITAMLIVILVIIVPLIFFISQLSAVFRISLTM